MKSLTWLQPCHPNFSLQSWPALQHHSLCHSGSIRKAQPSSAKRESLCPPPQIMTWDGIEWHNALATTHWSYWSHWSGWKAGHLLINKMLFHIFTGYIFNVKKLPIQYLLFLPLNMKSCTGWGQLKGGTHHLEDNRHKHEWVDVFLNKKQFIL